MKYLTSSLILLFLMATSAQAREIAVTVHKLDSMNVGESIGVIVAKQTAKGVMFTPFLRNLQPGQIQFSLNEHVGCQGRMNSDGTISPGMAAGNALQQFPLMTVNAQGEANEAVLANNLKLDDIIGRTLVLSKADTGQTAGTWGNNRIACGSLETYIK